MDPSTQFCGAPALALHFRHTGIVQLDSFTHTSQQQAATAHISASNKFGGKHESRAKLPEKGLHIFWGCDTPK